MPDDALDPFGALHCLEGRLFTSTWFYVSPGLRWSNVSDQCFGSSRSSSSGYRYFLRYATSLLLMATKHVGSCSAVFLLCDKPVVPLNHSLQVLPYHKRVLTCSRSLMQVAVTRASMWSDSSDQPPNIREPNDYRLSPISLTCASLG